MVMVMRSGVGEDIFRGVVGGGWLVIERDGWVGGGTPWGG